MKAGASLSQINQRIAWLDEIIKNPVANQRSPRNKLQTYKTERSKLIRQRNLFLTPPLL
jgi:hypothetical protein